MAGATCRQPCPSAEEPRGVLQKVGTDGVEQDHAGDLGCTAYEHLRDAVMGLLVSVRKFGQCCPASVELLGFVGFHPFAPSNDLGIGSLRLELLDGLCLLGGRGDDIDAPAPC